jgi:hypothetical protein
VFAVKCDYPHLRHENASIGTASVCRCAVVAPAIDVETWGSDCPIALRERIAEQDRHIASLDCRFAGHVAELSGKHCPPGQPCDRCEAEARVERAEALAAAAIKRADEAEARCDALEERMATADVPWRVPGCQCPADSKPGDRCDAR